MTELELLVDFHKDAERQGPGSEADTLRALRFISPLPDRPLQVADIGCGTGAQTITLARQLEGHITAVDVFPQFLGKLNTRAEESGLQDKITTLGQSMDDLSFQKEQFDLIWSEGAIYIMGFAEGVKYWKAFLKPGGYLAVSEITWLTATRPAAIEDHWQAEYPQIDTASRKIQVLEKNGFSPVGYFVLPERSWMKHYYQPMQERMDAFLEAHHYSESARKLIAAEKAEIEKYQAYKDYFSYGFYIAQKR